MRSPDRGTSSTRVELFALAALVMSACRLGAPSPIESTVPPVVIHEPFYAPESVERLGDLYGATDTASTAEIFVAFAEDLEEDVPLAGDVVVAPILAVTGTVVTYDIPMSDDPRVDEWVEYLTGRGRIWFERWLARSTRYVPIFWRILDQYGLPKDLVFLSMIESGFSPRAYSWAHAAGAWQFMPFTGRRFGLKIGFWVDERRDFERATHAAARLLSALYAKFDDWFLAWAAYNAGTGRMNKAIRRARTEDFWRLSRTWHLKKETRHYVPKMLAAARISKSPTAYGFEEVDYLPELEWEVLTVTVATDLKTLAAACGEVQLERMQMLNPELRCDVTPPGRRYPARVPRGAAKTCEAGLAALGPSRMTYRHHEVQRKDSLETIAAAYHTTTEAISTFNGMNEFGVQAFDEIVVPVPIAMNDVVPIREPPDRRYRPSKYGPEGAQVITHVVRRGESLWRIARRYRVSLKKLRLWNGLWRSSRLRIGQKLKIYRGGGGAPSGPKRRRRRL
ncbi:MAG: transglycosylase SLT domain-containing protein [Deltaproteobacteria bacterium]